MKTTTTTTVRLGMTELDVSPIAFGTWELGGGLGHLMRRFGFTVDIICSLM